MKKTYTKPEILFEDFSLNNSITVGCEKIAQQAEYECAYTVSTSAGDLAIFTDKVLNGACSYTQPDGYNEICYHVPSTANNVFTS